MDIQALIQTVRSAEDDQTLRNAVTVAIPKLDSAGLDLLWQALKQKSDELYRANTQRALAMANWMLELAECSAKPHHRAVSLLALANVYCLGLCEYRNAVDCYNQAAEIYAEQGMLVAQAQSQIGKILALSNLGRFKEALASGEWACEVLAEHGEILLQARVLVNMAILRGRLG